MSSGFLQENNGNNSNSRLIADMIIIVSLIFAGIILLVEAKEPDPNIMLMATSAGTVFSTIAGPALVFLFMQKKNEVEQDKKK